MDWTIRVSMALFVLGLHADAMNLSDENPGMFTNYVEGDMVLSDSSGIKSGDNAFRGNEKWIWPDGIVYYRLSSTIKTNETRSSMILEAMADITHEAPCVNFVDIEENNLGVGAFVDIVTYGDAKLEISGLGCHSEVGYQGRRQILNLQPDGCFHTPTIKHELLHTLGCVHEHSRPDVAEAIEVFIENIKPKLRSNFRVEKHEDEDVDAGIFDFNTPYDILSIMQYPSHAFAYNESLKTMQAKDPAFHDQFGYSEDFSVIDVVELNLRYKCVMTADLVFEYVNSYFDIMISRRRMDKRTIAKLEHKVNKLEDKVDTLEDQVDKLEDQRKVNEDRISKIEQLMEKKTALVAEDQVALIVGGSGSRKVELWSPSGKCNRQLKDLPVDGYAVTTNYINTEGGMIISCGGSTWKNKCYYLNPQTEDWVFHSTMLRSRDHHSSFVMNDTTLYIVGGRPASSSSTMEYLEPTTMKWIEGPTGNSDAGQKRYGACSLQTSPNSFTVHGGTYGSYTKLGEEYSFITKEWRTFGNADEARRYYHGCAMIETGNVYGILIAGGGNYHDYCKNAPTTSYFLDLKQNSPAWKKSSDTNVPHLDGRIVKLNNRYFILGGETTTKVEEYHPETGAWTTLGLPDVLSTRDQMYGLTAVPSKLFPNCN